VRRKYGITNFSHIQYIETPLLLEDSVLCIVPTPYGHSACGLIRLLSGTESTVIQIRQSSVNADVPFTQTSTTSADAHRPVIKL
jgi:hypothetical protein